jgi:hypothetical protein
MAQSVPAQLTTPLSGDHQPAAGELGRTEQEAPGWVPRIGN